MVAWALPCLDAQAIERWMLSSENTGIVSFGVGERSRKLEQVCPFVGGEPWFTPEHGTPNSYQWGRPLRHSGVHLSFGSRVTCEATDRAATPCSPTPMSKTPSTLNRREAAGC